jgi:ankyrin repeat protein
MLPGTHRSRPINSCKIWRQCSKGQILFHTLDRETGKFEVLEFLLGEGASINVTMYQNNYASWRLYSFMGLGTVLHKAAELGQADVAYFLLQKGIDTNIADAKGHTAFDCARTFKMNEVVKVIEKSLSQ